MKKSYQVKIILGAGETQTLDIASSPFGGSTTVKALPGARYQLIDTAAGQAPDNLRASRSGKDLLIRFDGREQADLVIADYYSFTASNAQALLGESQSGISYPYIPESGEWASSIAQMTDGVQPVGMALGSEPVALADFSPAGLGVIAAAAGFNPLWAAPLLLLGAAGGGGSAGAAVDTTPPVLRSASLYGSDDNGMSATDGITSINTPRITGDTEPNARVKVTINGHEYTGQADAQGHFVIPMTDPLPEGTQTYRVQATDAAGNSTTVDGTPFTVDTHPPAAPTGQLDGRDDTGLSATDGITGDNMPRITGHAEANASVKITINGHDYSGQADAQGLYVIPVTVPLPDGAQTYRVQATDAAGNSTTVDGTPFTVDSSSVSTSQGVGLSIDSITQDTGFDAHDFITGDNTLTWNGKLIEGTSVFNPADWVQVQLLDAQTQVLASQYVRPQRTAGVWNWNWSGDALSLADGIYTLKAQLVDTAGNVLSAPWAWSHNVTVDTQAQQLNGQPDPNADFSIHISHLLPDRGLSTTDFLTSVSQLTFTGNIISSPNHASFNANTGRVLNEIMDHNGKVVAFQYQTPSSTGDWAFDNTAVSLGVVGAVTTYTLKSVTVDNAGHFMNATTHAFTVDLHAPVVSNPGTVVIAGGNDYSQMSFSADELGAYIFNGVQQTSGTLDLGGLTHFEAGQFNMVFRDGAGNEWTRSNTQAWDFHLLQSITLDMSSSSSPAFDNAQLVGSVGTQLMTTAGQNLDLSSLYTLTPELQANGGINRIVMGTGAQTLTVSIGDVLELGISNSFANTAALKDHLQMRVDGDSADNLTLTKQWANSTAQSWSLTQGQATLDGQIYNVYNNEALKLDLFVQSAIHVTVTL